MGLGIVVALAVWLRPRRVVVEGRSMEPTLLEGDRLLVVRLGPVGVGDLVALRDPRCPERLLVKRVVGSDRDGVVVHGDNPAASTDSRVFGPVPASEVLGTVLRRYAPPSRRGAVL